MTFPNDLKLLTKVIEGSRKIAESKDVGLRRSFRRTFPKLRLKRMKMAKKARKMRTVAGALIRELRRKLPGEALTRHQERLDLYERVKDQKRSAKNKVYDAHTLPDVFELCWAVTGVCPSMPICDPGYRSQNQVGDMQILISKPPEKKDTRYQSLKARLRFRIESVIGHLKHDHPMARNYLKGAVGDAINLFMAAAAFNFRKWIRKIGEFFALLAFLLLGEDSSRRLAENVE